jgi:hypothetical protein
MYDNRTVLFDVARAVLTTVDVLDAEGQYLLLPLYDVRFADGKRVSNVVFNPKSYDGAHGQVVYINPVSLHLKSSQTGSEYSEAYADLHVYFTEKGEPRIYLDVMVYDRESAQPAWDDRLTFWNMGFPDDVTMWTSSLTSAVLAMIDWLEEHGA